MLSSPFAEDLFISFYDFLSKKKLPIQQQDIGPIYSFYEKISLNSELTKNQANFIIKLLEKYKNISAMAGFDYRPMLDNLSWRTNFRILDLSKKIYVEKRDGQLEICLKFPYQLKKQFDEEINVNLENSYRVSHWDQEAKVRRLSFYDFNLISLYEFAVKHNFEIDDNFMSVLAEVEEIWQNSEDVIPRSEVTLQGVILKNVTPEIEQWWNENKTENVNADLLLAKSMGIFYGEKPLNLMQKIASHNENHFWIKNIESFFNLINSITGRVCILLDRTSDTLSWLQNFVAEAEKYQIPRHEIKVCFRDSKEKNSGLNDWIKVAGVGGKVDEGKILIFESKPAKWLFKEDKDVKILVTNNIYPLTNLIAKDWFNSHPCVIYLGDTKPTEAKGQKIVEL